MDEKRYGRDRQILDMVYISGSWQKQKEEKATQVLNQGRKRLKTSFFSVRNLLPSSSCGLTQGVTKGKKKRQVKKEDPRAGGGEEEEKEEEEEEEQGGTRRRRGEFRAC